MISIFKNINHFAKRWKAIDVLAIFCARLLPYLMVIFLFFYSIYTADIYLFLYAILSGLFARFIINELVHLFYRRQRPAYIEQTKILIPVPKNYSFPSGHSSFFFGVSFFLLFYNIYLAITFLLLSFLVGTARVFCGVHWFRDILGGVFAGLVSAIIVYYLLNCMTIKF
jgi:undecaprenyl-diphosphatase